MWVLETEPSGERAGVGATERDPPVGVGQVEGLVNERAERGQVG